MKKRTLFLLLLIVTLGITACDFNSPLRDKMIEYYSDDNNYQSLDGVVVNIESNILEINITTPNHSFPININGCQEFELMNYGDWVSDIKVGDEISFISAPMYFYNGHCLPIVSLEKEGQLYLSFDKGKDDYLHWIKETFK